MELRGLRKSLEDEISGIEDEVDKIKKVDNQKVVSTKVVSKNELKQEAIPLEGKKETNQNNQSKQAYCAVPGFP